ncbi:hypothetical protein BWI17_19255 [Betaproteobacteria bacterium GR16-43]|nr:hypothetical protein BWI17_19255 [Betaproteobacteria bacterium GR16-43]
MIDLESARRLLDMGARIGPGPRADEQLQGSVALHNILCKERVAYLADEVGMGKTYVALGAVALFRHFDPAFRVLVIAPRENIQHKWQKEMRNFVANNVRIRDMRVKGIDGLPMRPLVHCNGLVDLVHTMTIAPDRDVFMRMTSFSLSLAGTQSVNPDVARSYRDQLLAYMPWLRSEVFDLRNKVEFKDNFARAVCCALPEFDLVIVDEAHNLKHGFGDAFHVSARNRVLALTMGHPAGDADPNLFRSYGSRAKRVLFLSATPVEETYRHLYNQLDVFGRAGPYRRLVSTDATEDEMKQLAARFLVRRVTSIHIAGKDYTKNLYRREWQRGGVATHDEPIHVTNVKQKLALALVQKKVAEILGNEKFNSSFQIGMLASFESFLQTAKVASSDGEATTFDDSEQTDEDQEKAGVDVADVNRLATSFREKFGVELPHPKMDALVEELSRAWKTGRKALVFVRRVASVTELKRKLDESYDRWLIARLRAELPEAVVPKLDRVYASYQMQRQESLAKREDQAKTRPDEATDRGGLDTFFAWFFRGEGPPNVLSGTQLRERLRGQGSTLATFFEDNYVALLLGCRAKDVEARVLAMLGVSREEFSAAIKDRTRKFLSSSAKRVAAGDRFEAVQAATIEWISEVSSPYQAKARAIWNARFETPNPMSPAKEGINPDDYLAVETFFTELRERPRLHDRLMPRVKRDDYAKEFREQELRRQLLASTARLGHAFIDFYILAIRRLGSIDLRVQESQGGENSKSTMVADYLDLLESQAGATGGRAWGAFDELSSIADNFELILDLNVPKVAALGLHESAANFGTLLGRQQPVGGMAEQINKTVVAQFRMPGYPFVLISTDLLQEGEDLHPFCSAVYHYGISWTPSSMEQRTGRIDRVRSATDRRLQPLTVEPRGDELLQVYLPHLEDTVEVFQVRRVLERMNDFLRLMHEGLTSSGNWSKRVNIADEAVRGRREVQQYREPLKTAFRIQPHHMNPEGTKRSIDTGRFDARLDYLRKLYARVRAAKPCDWEDVPNEQGLMGTAKVGQRIQPFKLHPTNFGDRIAVRCVSPIGSVGPEQRMSEIEAECAPRSIVVGALLRADGRTYDLTIEWEVLLSERMEVDCERIVWLIDLVVSQADDLEQRFLPDTDAPMSSFRKDLSSEGLDGRILEEPQR